MCNYNPTVMSIMNNDNTNKIKASIEIRYLSRKSKA